MVWRTTLITFTTCFLLGTTFTHWIADHNVLWRSPLTAEALQDSIAYYSLLGHGPAGLGWVYITIGLLGVAAVGSRIVSGYRGEGDGNGDVLFDGGSVVLLAGITYNQAVEVFPSITSIPSPLPRRLAQHALYPALSNAVRDLANDNVITAVMLTGVLLLQAGRYYSSRSSPSYVELPSEASSEPTSGAEDEPIRRPGTPWREMTEDEAMELASDDEGERKGAAPAARARRAKGKGGR
ncbi:hypothetical protein Q5752_002054 [Cryptotrichosporon argae]